MTELLRREAAKADSWRALAMSAGIDPSSLHKFLTGERSLRLDKADQLAKVLDIEVRKRPKAKR